MKKRNKILMIGLLSTALSMNMVGVGSTKISINRKTYQEGNTNLVLSKILSDNELKQEIPHMFNYASTGNYYDGTNDPNFVTEGLYSNVDEDGTTYYYRGNVKNNNLQFGAYDEDYYVYGGLVEDNSQYYQSQESCQAAGVGDCSSQPLAPAGSKMYWKIVRINGDGSIRLIYNGTSANASSFTIGSTPYNLNDDDPKYTGYTYDNGTDSFIKREIDTWYNNTLGKNSAYDSMVILGRFCSDSSGYQEGSFYNFSTDIFPDGNYSYASMGERLANFARGVSAVANSPTLKCPSTNESYGGGYRLKAGLITADELALAGESSYVVGNSYLNPGENGDLYWSMTPGAFRSDYAGVWGGFGILDGSSVDDLYAVRPVINVTTDNGFASGDGTAQNPYILNAE